MLLASFSKMNLKTEFFKSESMADASDDAVQKNALCSQKMDTSCQEQVQHKCEGSSSSRNDFKVPLALLPMNSPKLRSPRKLRVEAGGASPINRMYPKPTPAPRSSTNSDGLDPRSDRDNPALFSKSLMEKLRNLKECGDRKLVWAAKTPSHGSHSSSTSSAMNSPFSVGPSALRSNSSFLVKQEEMGHPRSGLSEELLRLCSGSSWSAFNSDSDNSSCLFAETSYMSSADFTDDVFSEAQFEPGAVQSPTKSNSPHDSLCQDVSIEFCKSEQPDVILGAALTGSPSKVRHQSSRAVRRVKSASALKSSSRYSPYASSPRKTQQQHAQSGRRWYKAKTDPYLGEYDDGRKERIDETDIALPKRVLRFDVEDSASRETQAEKLPQADVMRTDTPESGYCSLNSTQRTPDLAQMRTPVSSCQVKSASRGLLTPNVRGISTVAERPPQTFTPNINCGPVPWLETFDVISKLFAVEPSLVNHILLFLEPKELVLCSSVSRRWRYICTADPDLASVRLGFLEERRKTFLSNKENVKQPLGGRQKVTLTRPGTPLANVQHLGQPAAESTPLRPISNAERFHEVGQQLSEGQCLEKCPCGSPARVDGATPRRARCARIHCQREFCVRCRMGYHGDSPCTTALPPGRSPAPRGPSVGSRRSKRNLRRHSRLSSTDV